MAENLTKASLDKAKSGPFAWEMHRRPPAKGGRDPYWVPVTLHLQAQKDLDSAALEAILDELTQRGATIAPYEVAHLRVELPSDDLRLMVLIERASLDALALPVPGAELTVLAIGSPVLIEAFSWPPMIEAFSWSADLSPFQRALMQVMDRSAFAPDVELAAPTSELLMAEGDQESGAPLVGIIDDGIAFLNRRFCTHNAAGFQTRFEALWLQSEILESTSQEVPLGMVLEPARINALLNSGSAEADLYRELNASLYPPPSQQATNTSAAHGTHVLDLAAGRDPGEAGPPLIAVQLAPGMLWDTSGRRLQAYLVMGLRWIVQRALTGIKRDLVVNISLGSLAGPGDDTNPVASAIAAEIATYQRLAKREMRVVIAYGNAWRGNLVAEFALKAGEVRKLDWRLQPDGCSSSYLEMRVTPGTAPTLTLLPPDGGAPVTWRFGGAAQDVISAQGQVVGQILPLPPESTVEAVLLALAPTASESPQDLDLAPAGAWRLTVTADEETQVSIRVQRNETPMGYRHLGRQSTLADPGVAGWDEEIHGFARPTPASAIVRHATANAYAGLKDQQDGASTGVYYVGAARPNPGALAWAGGPATEVPWAHSAEGRKDVPEEALRLSSTGPTLSAWGAEGQFLPGIRASGVLGAVQSLRLSGTSVAAGLVTRRLAEVLAHPKAGLSEMEDVLGAPPGGARDSRLGFGTLPFPA